MRDGGQVREEEGLAVPLSCPGQTGVTSWQLCKREGWESVESDGYAVCGALSKSPTCDPTRGLERTPHFQTPAWKETLNSQ